MKSHVKENLAKQAIASNMRFVNKQEDGFDVEFSEFVQEIIKQQAPGIKFTNWRKLVTDVWTAKATRESTSKTVLASGSDINACIQDGIEKLRE